MNTIKTVLIILFVTGMYSCKPSKTNVDMKPVKVELKQTDGRYLLHVNGEPFFVKGAGCEFGNIEALGKHGANSFRTWRTENDRQDAKDVLDRAYKSGLLVLMGLEVGKERHGFSYDDTTWVKKQFEYLKGEVMRLKDHPALLGWAIGNELNLRTTDWKVYDAVNDISKMIHEVDPNHVTTTTTAGIGKVEVDEIKKRCTDIDFLSIQMYGDIVNLRKRIEDAGWDGPYMVTEWGATGHWEVPSTPWNAPIEQTSMEKAEAFQHRYEVAIMADKKKCLGSYVFLWGQKQERTPTWYGMFLESGEETETVDAMHYIWNGKWPENRCPVLGSLRINGHNAYDTIIFNKGEKMNAAATAHDFDGDTLVYQWEIIREAIELSDGGDHEKRPETIVKYTGNAEETLAIPLVPGAYRIFVYVLDGHNHAATANIPFMIKE